MSVEKNMNTRIQHKHDIEANWNKAVNFIPKAGEIIVYDKDENHNCSRFKIGDGIRTIGNLEFSQTDLTGYATESYVDSAVASLVNAAPEALNTLSELAAALGDDENFANTVTTELSKKANSTDLGELATKDSLSASDVGALSLAGGTMTGEIKIGQGDGYGIQLGTNGRINATVGTNTKATMFGVVNGVYYLGHSGFDTTIRGSAVRPTYNGNNMALYSDVSSLGTSKQDKITGTAGQFVVIGDDGNVTTKTISNAEEATF